MSRRSAMILYAFAGWTVFVWVVFVRNVAQDHHRSFGFKMVHITLAVISLAFAVGSARVVHRERRSRQ